MSLTLALKPSCMQERRDPGPSLFTLIPRCIFLLSERTSAARAGDGILVGCGRSVAEPTRERRGGAVGCASDLSIGLVDVGLTPSARRFQQKSVTMTNAVSTVIPPTISPRKAPPPALAAESNGTKGDCGSGNGCCGGGGIGNVDDKTGDVTETIGIPRAAEARDANPSSVESAAATPVASADGTLIATVMSTLPPSTETTTELLLTPGSMLATRVAIWESLASSKSPMSPSTRNVSLTAICGRVADEKEAAVDCNGGDKDEIDHGGDGSRGGGEEGGGGNGDGDIGGGNAGGGGDGGGGGGGGERCGSSGGGSEGDGCTGGGEEGRGGNGDGDIGGGNAGGGGDGGGAWQ